ncbi:Beta-lactamase superfamily domain containing protein [Naviculisporaceae sp. PSN 640]
MSTTPHCAVSKLPRGKLPVPEGDLTSHHVKDNDGKLLSFHNPHPSAGATTYPLPTVWKLIKGSISGRIPSPSVKNAEQLIPIQKQPLQLDTLPSSPQALRATWLGHAAYHVTFPNPDPASNLPGLRVLFDPVFEPRCSGVQWAGPKRYTPAPCTPFEIAPHTDAVIISHSHYDHLSYTTITQLFHHNPQIHFFVGLGLKPWFVTQCSIPSDQITELDWWEDAELNLSRPSSSSTSSPIKATISCLPCQHASGRSLTDRNHTLWASWSVTSSLKSVYFGGDTGYRTIPPSLENQITPDPDTLDMYAKEYDSLPRCPSFAQIGQLRGPFDLGLLPIGAYKPRWMWSSLHASPRDAVEIFKDTRCKRAMGIHWGTWVLTSEEIDEPPRLLREAMRDCGLEETGVFDVCAVGESREF